ncbi:uncharacterized protein LOC124461197 [Drosophila willistoni]|uniref:uncharacterized protein LOC124461197 n=1 Tax=Drosophila willistoni TaxID=7260 RepID=UPI001F07F47B|nr:uncharacterized protein LOC124461197 [Drosophila willistoni]
MGLHAYNDDIVHLLQQQQQLFEQTGLLDTISGIGKLDADTRRRWIERSMGNEAPTLEEFFKFLDDRCSCSWQNHINTGNTDVFSDLQLADSEFTTSAPIDVLLGGEHVWSTITGKKLYDNTGKLIAISSVFGWVISSITMPQANNAFALTSYIDVNASLQRFWELEDISSTTKLEPDDEQVEKHFLATHTRDEKGKYIVELPFKVTNPELGDTLQGALNRFQSVERRLQQDANLRAKYVNFMGEYFDLGHMRELPPDEVNNDQRRHSQDVSADLGEQQTPRLPENCLERKAIGSNQTLSTMHRHLWHLMCTFLAVRVLEQLATDHQQEFPNAARILQEDFYVDDVLTGSNNLDMLQHIQITRLVVNDTDNIELHGFSDASTKASAAVVYSRVINKDGSISTSIMAAKSRMAPLKQQSLPRLELCAALLLSQLIRSIKAALRHQKVTVFAWCDSTIVLYWLSYAPSRLKTFVGNRTSEILDTIPRHYWRHVDSKSNPADCASRGLMAADLKDFQLWWNGPSWIRDVDQFMVRLNNSQVCLNISEKNIEKEVKSNCLTALVEATPDHPLDHLVQRVSSWLTLVHAVGYVLRFLRRTKGPFGDKGSNCLTFEEITAARIVCLRHAQTCFQDDYQLLLANKPLRSRSQLAKLSPMIDKDGLLRVGGRLHHSQLSTEAKHPVLLPKSHRITKLILEYEHRVNLHPGVPSLFVMRHHTSQQMMGDLPSIRVTQALPFVNTGCDYAGPILLKDGKGRKPLKHKRFSLANE